MNLYLTADRVGIETGGGKVTQEEVNAFGCIHYQVWERHCLEAELRVYGDQYSEEEKQDPWAWDNMAVHYYEKQKPTWPIKLCHIYAGTFSKMVAKLKEQGTKVSYTAAAHSIQLSKEEHEKYGVPFAYPHLTEPELFRRYVGGYLQSDCLICPSTNSANIMRSFGARNKIEVIPHGTEIPDSIELAPKSFALGYLGSWGPDKGVVYLLMAWKKLAYKDATLVLAGKDSASPFARQLIEQFGGGNIHVMGWVDKVSDFYNSISCYVQPSVTEGFGIEVLEAQAHGRPVICSDGAGAVDVVPDGWNFPIRDVDALCQRIEFVRGLPQLKVDKWPQLWYEKAKAFSWDKIRQRYVDLWKNLLGDKK